MLNPRDGLRDDFMADRWSALNCARGTARLRRVRGSFPARDNELETLEGLGKWNLDYV